MGSVHKPCGDNFKRFHLLKKRRTLAITNQISSSPPECLNTLELNEISEVVRRNALQSMMSTIDVREESVQQLEKSRGSTKLQPQGQLSAQIKPNLLECRESAIEIERSDTVPSLVSQDTEKSPRHKVMLARVSCGLDVEPEYDWTGWWYLAAGAGIHYLLSDGR